MKKIFLIILICSALTLSAEPIGKAFLNLSIENQEYFVYGTLAGNQITIRLLYDKSPNKQTKEFIKLLHCNGEVDKILPLVIKYYNQTENYNADPSKLVLQFALYLKELPHGKNSEKKINPYK